MSSRGIATMVAAGVFAAVTAHAATPAQKCQTGKNKVAGKYAYCRQRAEARYATFSDAGARTLALQKCVTKYAAKWPVLEQKAVAAGGACLTVGDQAGIQTGIDEHTDDIAEALAGGGPPDCGGDLPTCNSDLTSCQADLATCQAGIAAEPLRTGQTICWDSVGSVIPCASTGQDGELQKGIARDYVDNGDGTVTDAKTGLMWEKLSDDGSIHDWDNSHTWADAFAVKIATLNGGGGFAGYTDWRGPNVNELQNLVNYGAFSPAVSPAFQNGCAPGCTVLTCSCTQSGFYWSSSSHQNFQYFAWYVSFYVGHVETANKEGSYYVRAVRAGS